MSARADKRNQFGLQVSPRGKQEVTRVTWMLEGVGALLGIKREVVGSEVR